MRRTALALALLLATGVTSAQTLTNSIPAVTVLPAGCVPLISAVGANYVVQCSGVTPTAPSGCGITGLPSGSVSAPYAYSLGVTCTGGATPTAWQWSGGSTATTPAIAGSVSATTAFGVVASNAGGNASQANGTITVGGVGPISCPGFAATRVLDIVYDPKGGQTQAFSSTVGGFGANDILVTRFTVGTAVPNQLGNIEMGEFSGPPTTRQAKLSATPCDLTGGGQSQEPNQHFSVGPNSFGAFAAQPNTMYYFNAKNVNCKATCDVIVILQAP